jgi:endonuclease I
MSKIQFRARHALAAALLAASLPAAAFVTPSAQVFVNEVHYDNEGTDVGEAIEIAAPAGTSLAGWSVVLYNGSNGTSYATFELSGSVPDQCGGWGTIVIDVPPATGLQNGSPDGLALLDGTDVVHFLSYEGTFTAANGPAAGFASTDIGVSQPGSTPIGQSLQLQGNGSTYQDFSWTGPVASSFAACNAGQSFGPGVDLPPALVSLQPADGATNVPVLPAIAAQFSEAVTLAPGALTLACAGTGAIALDVTGGPSQYQASVQTPLPHGTSCTLTVHAALVTDLDGTPDALPADISHVFSTGADLPPAVASHVPSDGAAGVATGANLGISFSEPVTTSPGWLQLACDDSGNVAVSVSGGPTQFVVDPDADLAFLETCTVTVDASFVLDQDGTPTPMAADYAWSFTTASDGGDYYGGVDASSAAALRQTLHEVIDDHQWFPYTSGDTDTWDILEAADEDPNDPTRILDIYRNESMAKFGGGQGPYNREHTWPNSLGFPSNSGSHAYTDTHMLMLSHVGYNSDRGNKYFGTCSASCSERATLPNDGAGGGTGSYPGNSNWFNGSLWETWVGRRGDVARAVMYMDIRYEGGTHANGWHEPDLILTDDAGLIQTTNTANNGTGRAYMGLLSVILSWHEQDPPDAKERLRNEVVFSYQGNRNPFIDRPEWAACLFRDECAVGPADGIFADGFER